jgi:hypothetical protein
VYVHAIHIQLPPKLLNLAKLSLYILASQGPIRPFHGK